MIYVMSNLHGCLDEWKEMMGKISFKQSDELYILGDVIDKGPKPVELLFELMGRANVFSILGNHEYMFLKCFKNVPPDATTDSFAQYLSQEDMETFAHWIKDGGRVTFEQFMELSQDDREAILDYLDEFTPYDEIKVKGRKFVLTHSGISNFEKGKSLDDYSVQDFISDKPQKNGAFFDDKILVYSSCAEFEADESTTGRIIFSGKTINLNACCDNGGHFSCLRLDDLKEFYI